MATTSTTTAINTSSEVAQLRHIPLSRIVVVPDAFNPRGVVADDRELEALAESLRRHGCLQPIRVRATNDGDYLLIAGERRYRAAVKAALMELPAIIRPAGGGDAEEQAQLLIEAVIENDQRVNLDALARARGYQRLIDSGLTVRGVAQRLTTTQARVREHLRILRLPEPAQAKLAAGVVPLRAVKALATLTRIHPGLAQAAIAQILDVDEHDSERYTWADLERAPLEVAAAGDELPDSVYRTHVPYPLDGFELSERTRKDLAALEQLLGHPLGTVRFGPAELEQARRLGAAHGEERPLIVGADVAGQIAGDYITRCVKTQRANQRDRERALDAHQPADAQDGVADAEAEHAAPNARRAQRDAERQARAQAASFNAELGRGVYTSLSRVKVDERALKLLS